MLRSSSAKGKRPRAPDQPSTGAAAASSSSASNAGPENQDGQQVAGAADIRWHFCNPNPANNKAKRPPGVAGGGAAAAQRSEQRNKKQVSAILDLMQRGKNKMQKVDGAEAAAAAEAPQDAYCPHVLGTTLQSVDSGDGRGASRRRRLARHR